MIALMIFLIIMAGLDNSEVEARSSQKICLSYDCFKSLTNANRLDAVCRKISHVDLDLCYCCGGKKKYLEYGTICRRYCLYERTKDEVSKPKKPCKLKEGIPEFDDSISQVGIFPSLPTKLPLNNLTCSCQESENCDIYKPPPPKIDDLFASRINLPIRENPEEDSNIVIDYAHKLRERRAIENNATKFSTAIIFPTLILVIFYEFPTLF